MKRSALVVLFLGLLLGLTLPAHGQPTYYLRNRPVVGRVSGDEVYVPFSQLSRYLNQDEVSRVKLEASQISVDGQPVTSLDDAGTLPLVTLVRHLGFDVKTNAQSGTVDLNPPGAQNQLQGEPAPELDSRRRQEYQLAARRMAQVLQSILPYDDPDMQARVEAVGQKVVRACPLANLEWHFYLVNSRGPNAACVGEGHVFVTRGLLDMGVSDDELAGVLGHEIAHGVRRHPFHRLDLAQELVALLNDYQTLSQEIQSGHTSMSLQNRVDAYERARKSLQYRLDNDLTYSRRDEEEADILGMRYAVLAGYSADGLAHCLTKLQKTLVQQFGTGVLKDDMSHPPVKRRLEILERARANWKF